MSDKIFFEIFLNLTSEKITEEQYMQQVINNYLLFELKNNELMQMILEILKTKGYKKSYQFSVILFGWFCGKQMLQSIGTFIKDNFDYEIKSNNDLMHFLIDIELYLNSYKTVLDINLKDTEQTLPENKFIHHELIRRLRNIVKKCKLCLLEKLKIKIISIKDAEHMSTNELLVYYREVVFGIEKWIQHYKKLIFKYDSVSSILINCRLFGISNFFTETSFESVLDDLCSGS